MIFLMTQHYLARVGGGGESRWHIIKWDPIHMRIEEWKKDRCLWSALLGLSKVLTALPVFSYMTFTRGRQ